MTFIGIHKSYENYDSYTFQQNDVLMDKPIYLGFSVLDLSKLLICETYFDKLQPLFGLENLKLHYMDCDSFLKSIDTQNKNNDLKNLKDLFDCSNLVENYELFTHKNKKFVGKFKIEIPENIWIDEFVCLRSKAFSFEIW